MQNEDFHKELLCEFKKITASQKASKPFLVISVTVSLLCIMLMASFAFIAGFAISEKNSSEDEIVEVVPVSWDDVEDKINQCDYEKALEIALKLKEKAPHESYCYYKVALILDSLDRLVEAEKNLIIAYDLWPSDDYYDALDIVQKKIGYKKLEARLPAQK